MRTKRLIALLAALLLLGSACTALAAGAGTASDPLVTESYVDEWAAALSQDAADEVRAAVDIARRSALISANRVFSVSEQGVRAETLLAGGTVSLSEGDCFTVTAGRATVALSAGALVDATAGESVSSGTVAANHLYIACEDCDAVLTAASETTLLLEGTAIVSRFPDASSARWYGEAVDYAVSTGLMIGMSETSFAPDVTLTRAMFVTILGRLAGADAGAYTGVSFSDVEAGRWYAPYVEWGSQNGIVLGVGDGLFAPYEPVTREQMALLVARYVDTTGLTLPKVHATPEAFGDASSISAWAQEGVELMRQTGILCGDTDGNFYPAEGATRAQAATVFMRLAGALAIARAG